MSRTRNDGATELAAQAAAQAKINELIAQLGEAMGVLRSRVRDPELRAKQVAERERLLEALLDAKREYSAAHDAAIKASGRGDGAYDAAVAARATLVERARRAMPELRTDSMSDRAIHEAVLTKLHGKLDLKTRSDAYVRGYFEQMAPRLDSAAPASTPEQDPRQMQLPRTYRPAWREALRASTRRLDTIGPELVRVDERNGGYRSPAWRSTLRTSSRPQVDQLTVRDE